MDNSKTGNLIKELRKEKKMTQRDLANQLHITDRAVSKWERGICAPDISLLEPLSDVLGVSILELIEGERREAEENGQEAEREIKQVLGYSKCAMVYRLNEIKSRNRKMHLLVVFFVATMLVVVMGMVWNRGYLHVVEKKVSPDGATVVTVYDKELTNDGFSANNAVSLITEQADGTQWRVTYGSCEYQGLWWAPDSKKYVLALKHGEETQLALSWLERYSESNLNAYLSMGVEISELKKTGYAEEDVFPDIHYQFLQWGLDSKSMLIYYSFEDKAGEYHEGYFWYDCESGSTQAILKLDMEE